MKNPAKLAVMLPLFLGWAAQAEAQSTLIDFDDRHTADFTNNSAGQVSPWPMDPLAPVQIPQIMAA